MKTIEIIITCFVTLLALVGILYVGYYQYDKVKKINAQIQDQSFIKEYYLENKKETKTKRIVRNVFAYIYLALSIGLLINSIVIKCNNDVFTINDQYVVNISSPSMASNYIGNTYLTNNGITDKLYVNDIIAFDKVNGNSKFKPMDILLYKKNVNGKDILIAHRLLKINSDGTLIMRGDANKDNDVPNIKKDDVIGIYSHRLEFYSFINYLGHMPYIYVAFGGICICLLLVDSANIYINSKIKKIKD